MSRFRPLSEIEQVHVTGCNQRNRDDGYKDESNNILIINNKNHDEDECNRVTTVTAFFSSEGSERGGGVPVATKGSFRARMRKAARHLPVELPVLLAEFANDAEDIAQGVYPDEALRKAVCSFMVGKLGLYPVEVPTSTPADDGMIRCMDCSYWVNRCRHPGLHGGLWPELDGRRWRRCTGFADRQERCG